ncbi:MAG: CvpA family protein, partial [Lachnospiraceae bacterium]|nr:CvpA family protein [Lachnospiraceae bacterium]
MNVTFIVALVVIFGLTVLGYVRGLIKYVWHFAGAIIVITLTLMLAPTVAKALNNNETIRSKVYEKV